MPRRTALVGLFAVLFQAILFGWHHHPEHFAVAGQWPALSSPQSGAPLSPAAADDECELCAALHHLTSAPAEFILVASPPVQVVPRIRFTAARRESFSHLSFRARAPPLA